jgi:ADP-heptose:LPS heptosyltransferase
MKFLIVCFSSPATVLFLTPVIRALKVQAEDAEVHLCVKAFNQYVLADNPYVDTIYPIDPNFWKTSLLLKEERYDFVFDFENNIKSFLLSKICNAKTFRLNKRRLQSWLMTNLKINLPPTQHITERFFEVVRNFDLKQDDLGLDYFIPEQDKIPVEWLPLTHQHNYVVVIIEAPYNTRKLSTSRLIELCDKINKPIVLIGSKNDFKEGGIVEDFFKRQSEDWEAGLKELNKKTIVFNACGKFSLHQYASIIKKAQHVFTYDNDFVPIASAFKRNTFLLLGNTTLQFGRYPYKTKYTILENNKIGCRPCSSKGYDRCPRGHFKCMNEMVFDFYLGWRN